MDKEQQIKINFLDEAEDYFDNIESVLLSLASEVAEPKKLDLALRAAHSVKGGAGMMGFMTLSRLAHDLEDFFKILRARYCATKIDVEVETLLLQSLDLLRDVSNLHRQGVEIAPNWWDENVQSILSALSEHLGELEDEDELKLLNDNDTVHSTLEMVEEGMENILDEFEQKLPTFTHSELSSELNMVAEQLTALATFVDLDSLVQLCESIQSCAMSVDEETLPSLAQKSLSLWQRSQALIMRRSFDKLPSVIEGFEAPVMANSDTQLFSEDELFVPTDDIDEFNLLDNPSEEKLVELQNSLEQELEKQADSDLDLLLGDPWTSPDLAEIHDIFSDEDLGETTEDLTVLETYLELETKLQSTPLPNQPAEAQSLHLR